MEDRIDNADSVEEPGEEQLHQLIKEAGEEARLKKKKAMEKHRRMIQEAVEEGMSRWEHHIST